MHAADFSMLSRIKNYWAIFEIFLMQNLNLALKKYYFMIFVLLIKLKHPIYKTEMM